LNGQSRGFVLRQQGRISRLEPVVQTNLWVYTNEFAEVVTQATEQVAGHVLHWGGIWGGVNTTRVFTVEACDSLPASNWAPVLPTAQWPIVEFTWTNTDLGSAATRFYRVRAE
jgi:hypothetical protein